MSSYTPPRRLMSWRQTSPSAVGAPRVEPGTRPPIRQVPGQPIEFMHEHYRIRLERETRTRDQGEPLVRLTATAFLVVDGMTDVEVTSSGLRMWDKDIAEGRASGPPALGSPAPHISFPPYVILCDDTTDRASVEAMSWRCLEGAVALADQAMGYVREVGDHRGEYLAQSGE
ncbi:hypothetical protein [Streptomyces cinereoruber]|uniref:hypothetical protein n=1 Tax=Streptomyces cinereoruber TaxID=67260 RepID=UPI003C30159F